MLNFSNINIHSIVANFQNFNGSRIAITERHVKQWMKNQEIKATKANVLICKNDIIEEIKKYYSVVNVISEINGDITIQR